MNVETISAQPNTPEWLKHRASCYNASELAAAMGLSKYQSRDDLIKRLATGITPDFIVVDGAEGGTGAAPLGFYGGHAHNREGGSVVVRDQPRGREVGRLPTGTALDVTGDARDGWRGRGIERRIP